MNLTAFAIKWFTIYYLAAGTLVLATGFALLAKPLELERYLSRKADESSPPEGLRRITKYLFVFTLPCFVLSFYTPSWVELLFSLWSLFMVYEAGILLARWEHSRHLIREHRDRLPDVIRYTGAIMVAVALVIYSLDYLLINRITLM